MTSEVRRKEVRCVACLCLPTKALASEWWIDLWWVEWSSSTLHAEGMRVDVRPCPRNFDDSRFPAIEDIPKRGALDDPPPLFHSRFGIPSRSHRDEVDVLRPLISTTSTELLT